jgi:hypothetical protein
LHEYPKKRTTSQGVLSYQIANTNMEKIIKRLEYLSTMLNKYQHRWNDEPSDRMFGWVDEYNGIKADHREAFVAYCEKHGWVTSHDAYDCLA